MRNALVNQPISKEMKERIRIILVYGVLFLLSAHLYRWNNSMFNHDSLLVFQGDTGWQISLGRILIPAYTWMRGRIAAPIIIALFGSFFLLLSVLLCVQILKIEKKSAVILCIGIMTTFETLAFDNATFLQWFDVQMLALLFASLSAYFLISSAFQYRYPLGGICCILSMCLYQGYVEVLIVLILLALQREVIEGSTKGTLLKGLSCVRVLLFSGVCYMICVLLTWRITGIKPGNSYNSLTQMQNLQNISIMVHLWRTWCYPFHYLLHSEIAHRRISAAIYCLLGLFSLLKIISLGMIRKMRWGAWFCLGIILLVFFPLGSNLVYFLNSGIKHGVMTFSFAYYTVWAIMVYDFKEERTGDTGFRNIKRYAVPLLCSVLILNHIIFSNQLYIKKDLETHAGISFMTRMVDRIEQTDGYKIGETRVAILGQISDNPAAQERKGFSFVNDGWVGTYHYLGLSYYRSYSYYFEYILGYPVHLAELWELEDYINDPDLQDMPVFPSIGSTRMVGDTLVIRVSEDMRPQELRY